MRSRDLSSFKAALSPFGYGVDFLDDAYCVSQYHREDFRLFYFQSKRELEQFIAGLEDGRGACELAELADSRDMWSYDGYDEQLAFWDEYWRTVARRVEPESSRHWRERQ